MPKGNPRTTLTIRIGPAGLARLDALAGRRGLTRSELLRRIVAEYLERTEGR